MSIQKKTIVTISTVEIEILSFSVFFVTLFKKNTIFIGKKYLSKELDKTSLFVAFSSFTSSNLKGDTH